MPGQHHGPSVAGILRRGEHSDVAQRQEAERATREATQLAIAKAQAADAEQAARAALEAQERVQAERQRLAAMARQEHEKAVQQLA